jgi:hypothetical protein
MKFFVAVVQFGDQRVSINGVVRPEVLAEPMLRFRSI